MEELRLVQERLLKSLPAFRRYIAKQIDWQNRLIAIKGARGTGKTTLLLQRLKFDLSKEERDKALYASLDDLFFLENSILDLAHEFAMTGGKFLFLDEVHKYPRWSRELKLIYDRYPELNVVFTSSSMLNILGGESDLSRRAVSYGLQELSYREFLELKMNRKLPVFTLKEIVKNHREICNALHTKLEFPLKHFKAYLKFGSYPYFFESKSSYHQKLFRTVMLIVESDMNAVENISYGESRKIKKLLLAIAQSAPFTPNISKLSERLGVNRKVLIKAIRLLVKADLVLEFFKPNKGIGAFTKPEKLYLHNTNLLFALDANNVQKGTLRETFVANQLAQNHRLNLVEKGDFLVDEKYVFEIGGRNKTNKQIQNIHHAYVLRDDIEFGTQSSIPLWLFGFLY